MRYYTEKHTLFVRGFFRAACAATGGGLRDVTTLLFHVVYDGSDPERETLLTAYRAGVLPELTAGLVADAENCDEAERLINCLCVLRIDEITCFIMPGRKGDLNIILYSSIPMPDCEMVKGIGTVAEGKTAALISAGEEKSRFSKGMHEIIVASDHTCGSAEYMSPKHSFKELHAKIYNAVYFGVQEVLKRRDRVIKRSSPSFFIFSRYGGEKWFEWQRGNCEYYPCHFKGQRCDFCYCPLYPCMDETLGNWVESSAGAKRIWSCSSCLLNHQPVVVDHLKKYPEAGLQELKCLLRRNDLPATDKEMSNLSH